MLICDRDEALHLLLSWPLCDIVVQNTMIFCPKDLNAMYGLSYIPHGLLIAFTYCCDMNFTPSINVIYYWHLEGQ